jgi:hypothetical protein
MSMSPKARSIAVRPNCWYKMKRDALYEDNQKNIYENKPFTTVYNHASHSRIVYIYISIQSIALTASQPTRWLPTLSLSQPGNLDDYSSYKVIKVSLHSILCFRVSCLEETPPSEMLQTSLRTSPINMVTQNLIQSHPQRRRKSHHAFTSCE